MEEITPVVQFPTLPAKESVGALIEIESARAVQEVQAAMIVAKKFPRDQMASYTRIMEACKRPSLAREATYAYPKGGTLVTGPSIRLAEVIAQNGETCNLASVNSARGATFPKSRPLPGIWKRMS